MNNEIVILSRSLPFHGIGGMEVVAWDLACEFARHGNTVRVITTAIPGREEEFTENNVFVVALSGTSPGRYSSSWWKKSREYFEENCMERTRAVFSVSAAAFGILPLKDKMHGVPFVMQAHGTSWGEALSKWNGAQVKGIVSSAHNILWLVKDLIAYAKFDKIVAIGEKVYKDLTVRPIAWTLQSEKVCLISNGIDTSSFFPSADARQRTRLLLGVREETPILISASRLHPQKGLFNSLRSFALLLKMVPEAVYVIAGDGPEKAKLELLCEKLSISRNVIFLGPLQREELVEYLQAADVFLFMTERVEGLPLNVLEALACGLPVVASDHLHLFESSAINLVAPRDYEAVSLCIQNLLRGSRLMSKKDGFLPQEYTLTYSCIKYLELLKVVRS